MAKLTGREIDMRMESQGWGNNVSQIEWNSHSARYFIWVTPEPKEGDILILSGYTGPIYTKIIHVRWTRNVDDMYEIELKPMKPNWVKKHHGRR